MTHPADTLSGYEILSELGRGTTGVVFKAKDKRLGRLVAVKMPALVPLPMAEVEIRKARFMREARVLAALTGKPEANIPSIQLVGEERGQIYYQREYVDGSTLEERAATSNLGLREGVAVLATIGRVVHRVHARGLAHRNLHPSNVLVGRDGTTKLIGFGYVGLLAGSDLLPKGSAGVQPSLDLQALARILEWLCTALQQDIPSGLRAAARGGSVTSVTAYAETLEAWIAANGQG
jgi:serine/threonine protein kinase